LLHYIKNDKLKFKCNSPINNIFIMANWNIYWCTKYNSIGNIKKENIDNILFNNEHNKIIKNIAENNCNKCFSLHWSYKSLN
jgi:MoaA/NifB/PqqE/SkfB family radical SAM enzyme